MTTVGASRDAVGRGAADRAVSESRHGRSQARVVVLFRKLDVGGAERQIIEFAKAAAASGTDMTLVSFYDGGELLDQATGIKGVSVVSLGKRGRWDAVPFVIRACRVFRELRPDVVYAYQGVANELAL